MAGHGGDQGVKIGNGQELRRSRSLPRWPRSTAKTSPIEDNTILNALICDFGTNDGSGVNKAAALATAADRTVRAANARVIVSDAGQYVADTLDPAGAPQFVTKPDHIPAGTWEDYQPGGASTIASALNPPADRPGSWALLRGKDAGASPPDPLSADRVSQALTQLDEQRHDDQQQLADLDRKFQDVTAALARKPTAEAARALNDQLREIGQEVAKLNLEDQERGEQAQLLTALQEARARHEDASQRLAEAKRQAQQGGPDDYGSLAAYELITRHEVADLRDIIGAWSGATRPTCWTVGSGPRSPRTAPTGYTRPPPPSTTCVTPPSR